MTATKAKKGKRGKVSNAGSAKLYDGIAARASAHILEASRKGRDIAPAPKVKNIKRRETTAASLLIFLESYFPGTFTRPWCDDHLKVIARLQAVITSGGQFALAMPRGSGKTSIVERSALWAVLTGRRRFVVIAAANESLAEQSLGRLKAELEQNDLLLADWPKAVYPIRRLESQARRCVAQLFAGQRTRIVWQRKRLVLPAMPDPDNEASGAVLHVAGLTGAVRGLSHVDGNGRTIRPDLLLVDDPQDRESAGSVIQTAERLALLNGDLLGLAGPGAKLAALATVTVIHRGDLADQLLDRDKNPAWQGERFKMVYAFPSDHRWDEYGKLRNQSLRAGGDGSDATEFYRRHQGPMDFGAVVAWPARKNPDELSAIQHAMNLRMDRGDEFEAEYQNEPRQDALTLNALDPVAIAARCNGYERGIAPPECELTTAFIDVGQSVLWWMLCGWTEEFSGRVLDYGCWPAQRGRMFNARNASPILEQIYPGGTEAAVYAGLTALVEQLFGRQRQRSDGAEIPLHGMIDSGWQSDVVRAFIRGSKYRTVLRPSKGVGIGPGQTQISDYHARPGEKIGNGWIFGVAGQDRLRLLRFDANVWKTRVASWLTRPMGTKGGDGITLYGQRPIEHELLALHLASEYPTPTSAKGVTTNVWARRPDADNHLWDCLIGCAVSASVAGLNPLPGMSKDKPVKQHRLRTLMEMAQSRLPTGEDAIYS